MTDCESLTRTRQFGQEVTVEGTLAALRAARARAHDELEAALAAGLATAAIEDRILDLDDQITVIAEAIVSLNPG
ncbi:hypothetical protein [Nocardia aurantiaca]|uniref:Uncharacterized protein n=1 Tax=Nocardia aurantiaca TaxID=2675850 RepID=A0A6I3KUI9_9NOCA|nr:hypothetical protein [Nocardia aurantiaca]MTE14473.1 hypothetical protein [Nocardia aurantiaca]